MTLEETIVFVARAHAGQVDKGGHPYILHLLRVMLAMDSDDERKVALLHDIVEDGKGTFEELRTMGFPDVVLDGVDAVTRREGEGYQAFVSRAAENRIGRKVKRADLIDNSDLSRIASPGSKDFKRLERYTRALLLLDSRAAPSAEPLFSPSMS